METPDGDFVDLDWLDAAPTAPLVLVRFLEGRWPWTVTGWAERRALGFLGPLLAPRHDLLTHPPHRDEASPDAAAVHDFPGTRTK